MAENVEFFEAVVTCYPQDADHAPLLHDPVHARVARADDVVDGDLILAAVSLRGADYFARNVRTIQVLIDRESILTGAAAGGEQPWKYYDLGEGYCSYDFLAKCPHRLACARCPFYVPKKSSRGQLLAVRDGIDQMLEQLDLTDDEREALEGDREQSLHSPSDSPTPPLRPARLRENSERPTASSLLPSSCSRSGQVGTTINRPPRRSCSVIPRLVLCPVPDPSPQARSPSGEPELGPEGGRHRRR